jgi:hypothetical protein
VELPVRGVIPMEAIWITLIESALTFAGICVTVIVSNKKANKKLEQKVDKLVEHDEDQYLSILRLTIMSENMPISERIIAGDKYVKKGGNGDVKKYYQKMLEEHTK